MVLRTVGDNDLKGVFQVCKRETKMYALPVPNPPLSSSVTIQIPSYSVTERTGSAVAYTGQRTAATE
jgi:hypothetical protein